MHMLLCLKPAGWMAYCIDMSHIVLRWSALFAHYETEAPIFVLIWRVFGAIQG